MQYAGYTLLIAALTWRLCGVDVARAINPAVTGTVEKANTVARQLIFVSRETSTCPPSLSLYVVAFTRG
jgi:hypothetical protein